MVPIFPQLRPYIEDCRELAEDGAEFVIAKHRFGSCNLRTTMQKIVKRAGLNVWPRLFQNLRSSRETELLSEGFQLQTVVAWLGNSPTVALKSYLQVREEDYQKATQKVADKAKQNPKQSTPESVRSVSKTTNSTPV